MDVSNYTSTLIKINVSAQGELNEAEAILASDGNISSYYFLLPKSASDTKGNFNYACF